MSITKEEENFSVSVYVWVLSESYRAQYSPFYTSNSKDFIDIFSFSFSFSQKMLVTLEKSTIAWSSLNSVMTNIDMFHLWDSRMRVKSARLRRRARNDPEGAFCELLTTLVSYFFLPSFVSSFLFFHSSQMYSFYQRCSFTFVERTPMRPITFNIFSLSPKKISSSWSLCAAVLLSSSIC